MTCNETEASCLELFVAFKRSWKEWFKVEYNRFEYIKSVAGIRKYIWKVFEDELSP